MSALGVLEGSLLLCYALSFQESVWACQTNSLCRPTGMFYVATGPPRHVARQQPMSHTHSMSHHVTPNHTHTRRSQRDYLLGKMREVEQKLSASKGVRQATERERRLASAANKLKVCASVRRGLIT